ncbi:MAG: hypothetical protein IPN61_02150 [Bacteroidetes bacterium]|nr:hypothetical protein [Bacteroidota bacterium]
MQLDRSSTLSSQARIRAFNIESARNIDSSLVPFNIISIPSSTNDKYRGGSFDGYNMCPNLSDSIKVLTPNGGEVLSPTNTVAITWNYRHIDNIKIEFSIDNGSTWNSIVSGIPASQLSYNWTVPNSPSTQCRIKITSLLNGVNDISDAAFTINSAFVNVIYPNGGESFGTGTGQYIEWNSNSVSTVKLEYSTNNGSTWTTIGTAPAANKYANWIPPTTVTTQCLIRISDNAVPSLNDLSDASFSLFNLPTLDANKYRGGSYDGYSMNSSIRDSIRVTSANGGETWTAASTRTIIWTYNDVDNVSIEYTLDDGLTWTTIAASVPASQLSYNWTVPTTPSFLCRIRVKDILRPISDQSDAVFVIPNSFVQILYPNGGERFGAGTGQYIEWNYNDLATIKLEYSTNNGSTWNVIGTAPAANKYANWVVPAIASNQLLIRATDLSNPIYTDQSNTVFTSFTRPTEDPNKFKGGQFDGYSMYSFKDIYVNVIRPNGGEIWGNGTTQQIRWTTLNLTENLNIEYSIDNEVNWTTLASNVSNTSGPFNWTISSPVSTICKVRAKTVSGSYFDKSDDFFTIANPNGIITDAITGNTFCSGANTTVNFTLNTAFNPGNRFIVQLSDSVGTFNGSVINIGEVTSTTPQPITVTYPQRFYVSSLYRLRVIGTNPPTLGTDNGVNFTINPLPNVNLGNDTVICPGSTIVLNAGNTATTYAWSTGASTSSIDVTQGGTYWVAVTNSCGTTRDSIVIQSRQLPSVNLGNDTLVCLNSSITLDAGTNASTYLWSTGDVSRQISVVVPGNYSVSVSNVCGTAADVIAIGNRPSAVVNLGADRGLCSGQTITLDAGNPGATYLWSTGSTTQSILVSAPGNYSVDVTDACGITSDQISIFNGAMTVNTGPDLSICSGASATLTATGANSYSWNTGQTSSSITVTPSANTTYTVIGTNIFNCTASDQIEVTVNNAPIAEIVSISGSTTYCDNNPSILTANQAAGLTYAWARNGVLIPNTNIISYLPLQSGQYAVVTTNTFGCSSTSIPVNITVLSTPQATITPSGNVTLCSGSNLQLDGNTGAGLTFQWLLNGNSINGATSAQYITGTGGSFTLSVTNADGCATISAPTNVQVNSSPVATITAAGPTTFCLGGSVLLQANTGQGLIYEWQKNGVNIPQATSVSYSATEGGFSL